MKKTIKLAVVAALALGATSAFATNGSTLIGTGAKTRGTAGVGIGMGHGAESALSNPALITTISKDHEISFGGTLFMPDVSANMGAGASTSAADMNVIPEVSLASKVNDNFYWGIGMWGTAGMGVDYRKESGYTSNFQMVTNLQLMQFAVPLAYTVEGFSVAVSPILQYGALDMNFNGTLDASTLYGAGATADATFGAGIAQDLSMGYNLGLSYEIADFTIGAVYKSEIEMEYDGQISGASQVFANFGLFGGQALSDKLSTPAEMGVGASYKMGEHTIAVDYKQIKWSSAKGYEDFKWDDQNVVAIGYEYATKDWAIRLGYNHASNPVVEQPAADGTDGTGSAINMLNALGFPAIVESHYALGCTYAFNDTTSLDLAYVYAPEVTETYTTAAFAGFGPTNPTSVEVKHSQTSASFQLNYAF